ncbi:hypothetical protein [Herbihabitans rhizosphaerae]|nr:hypothetical protein [Herbihabitans rhizosphaerae]
MWVGAAADVLVSDGRRRPEHPEFGSFPQLPYSINATLLKPASFIGGTWTDAGEAVAWLRRECERLPPPKRPAPDWVMSLDERCRVAAETLAGGKSVVWGRHCVGDKYADLRVVCCSPAEGGVTVPCPAGVA